MSKKLHTLKGSGPVDRKYLSKLYTFRDKVLRKVREGK